MECPKSFIAAFKFLDNYWVSKPDNELGMLLGSMNPFLFSHQQPIDSVILQHWQQCSLLVTDDSEPDLIQSFDIMILFIEHESNYYTLNLINVVNDLKKILADKVAHKDKWTTWIDCFLTA